MIPDNDPSITITKRANRQFIEQEGRDYACYSAVIRDLKGLKQPNAFSLRMTFDVSHAEAAQIGNALKHIRYSMRNDSSARFEVELQGDANITTGLNALFKRNSDGSIIPARTMSRPLVSPAMQAIIVEKLGGLVTTAAIVRENLDEDQKSAGPAIPCYD